MWNVKFKRKNFIIIFLDSKTANQNKKINRKISHLTFNSNHVNISRKPNCITHKTISQNDQQPRFTQLHYPQNILESSHEILLDSRLADR